MREVRGEYPLVVNYSRVRELGTGVPLREVREYNGLTGVTTITSFTEAEWFGCDDPFGQGCHRSGPPTANGTALGRYRHELDVHGRRCRRFDQPDDEGCDYAVEYGMPWLRTCGRPVVEHRGEEGFCAVHILPPDENGQYPDIEEGTT